MAAFPRATAHKSYTSIVADQTEGRHGPVWWEPSVFQTRAQVLFRPVLRKPNGPAPAPRLQEPRPNLLLRNWSACRLSPSHPIHYWRDERQAKREKLLKLTRESQNCHRLKGIPEWDTPESTAKWIRAGRASKPIRKVWSTFSMQRVVGTCWAPRTEPSRRRDNRPEAAEVIGSR